MKKAGLMDPEKSSIAGKDMVPGTIIRDAALRKERLPAKDKGGKNDEHVPEGASRSPTYQEWTENIFADGDWRCFGQCLGGLPAARPADHRDPVFSVYQYWRPGQEMRVERTLQLVELWERGEYQEAQKCAEEASCRRSTKNTSDLLGNSPSQTELAVYYEKRRASRR